MAAARRRLKAGSPNFNAIEIHRADVRIANSTIEDNANGLAVGRSQWPRR